MLERGILMNEIIHLLDPNLNYLYHELIDDAMYIFVESTLETITCPFCGTKSSKRHSSYQRSFQDLPIQEKKVEIVIQNRKMFCHNKDCKHTTFAERFDFINYKSKKTKRLEEEIIRLSLHCSSITAAHYLSRHTVKVGKSTICNLLKKLLRILIKSL